MKKLYIYSHKLNEEMTCDELTIACLKDYLQSQGHQISDSNFQVQIMRDSPHGKPYFKDFPEIYFNVSHSGDWWVCAYGSVENGLDLQRNAHNNTLKIAGRFFHPNETVWLSHRDPKQFFRVWAYKESFLKFTGLGLARGMNYFSVMGSHFNLNDDYEQGLPGAEGVYQVEIPFFETGYWMVLTTSEPVEIILKNNGKEGFSNGKYHSSDLGL